MQQAAGSNTPLQVIQFTDTHFFGSSHDTLMGVDTSFTFQQVVSLAHDQRGIPDFYLLTGDLSQDESKESYLRFAAAVREFKAPAYYLPGNHDIGAVMQSAFAEAGAPFLTDKSFAKDNWLVVTLDTHLDKQVGGHLGADELNRLDEQLSAHPSHHALITMHHHPVPVGSNWLDQIGVDNGEEFLRIVDKHPQVRGVVWGHIHQDFETERNGVSYMGTPSTCVQFQPRSQAFAIDAVPPGYRWLELHADGRITSGVSRTSSVAPGLDLASGGY